MAGELDVPVAFDVNLREHLWEGVEAAHEAVEPLFDRSRVVKLSGEELGPLLGTEEPGEAAQTLLDRGVALVLVSMGERGAFYATEAFQGSVPAFVIEAVDAAGAGHAFIAPTLVRLSEGVGRGAGARGRAARVGDRGHRLHGLRGDGASAHGRGIGTVHGRRLGAWPGYGLCRTPATDDNPAGADGLVALLQQPCLAYYEDAL